MTTARERKNVLFVCIGNICRSPMAEAFANRYGADVLRAQSAGLSPAIALSPFTRKVMEEKNIDIGNHLPRGIDEVNVLQMDVVVNMSGYKIPGVRTVDWTVADPYGGPAQGYRVARDRIEMLVMQFILKLRMGRI
jgi:arsenate reductase